MNKARLWPARPTRRKISSQRRWPNDGCHT
jgi:hypothetical protein